MLNLLNPEAGTPHPRTESVALVVTGALLSIFPEHSPSVLMPCCLVARAMSASGFSPVGPVTFPRLHH